MKVIPVLLCMLTATTCFAITINVPKDQNTIQAGINAAANGDTVLVADGTYFENINYKGKAITVASHFILAENARHISNTIINGSQPTNPDSGSVVYFVSGEDTTSVLTGFTITQGTGTITTATWGFFEYPGRAGGGIFCYNSSARISFNRITRNHISKFVRGIGGGIAGIPNKSTAYLIVENNDIVFNTIAGEDAWSSGVDLVCNGRIINNNISFNNTDAKEYAWGAVGCSTEKLYPRRVQIMNNRIAHNKAKGQRVFGGGIGIEEGSIVCIVDNEIFSNEIVASEYAKGGGIYLLRTEGTTLINRNTLKYNKVYGSKEADTDGGGISIRDNTQGSTIITNNIISGNFSSGGGGIYSRNSNTRIINNTIVNNAASYLGGGLGATGIGPNVINSIFWNNDAPTDPQLSGPVTVVYSNIQDCKLASGFNISSNPMFVDTLYNLSKDSPCIGAGTESVELEGVKLCCPSIDMAGKARPYFPADFFVDIGALESVYPRVNVFVQNDMTHHPLEFQLKQNYPNPFNPVTTIEYSIPESGQLTLIIYDLLGRQVRVLENEYCQPGHFTTTWDGLDDSNNQVSSGSYFCRMEAREPSTSSGQRFLKVIKLTLVR